MSWNNVIPAELLLGEVSLTPKEVENPEVIIPRELVTDCLVKWHFDECGTIGTADHPAFAELRKVLNSRGYIKIPEYACWNGDRVKKRFIFNGIQLEPGDTFYCAGAWSTMFTAQDNREKRL